MNDPNRVMKWLGLIGMVVISLLILYPPHEKLKGGIDLVGGTSLLFEIDTTDLTPDEQKGLSERVMGILKERVDPKQQLNLEWRPVGSTRLEIRMPRPPKVALERREKFNEAVDQLGETNVFRREFELALHAESGVRDAQLDALVRGVPERKPMIDALKTAYDEYSTAKSGTDPAITEKASKAYEDAMTAVLATNIPTQRVRDVMALPPGTRRNEELDRLRKEFPFSDSGAETSADGKLLSKIVTAYDAWAKNKADLEDPSDLKRRIRGAGVLEFRILADRDPSSPTNTTDPNPQLNQPITRYSEQLVKYGPRIRPGDRFRWLQVEDIRRFMDIKDMEAFLEVKDQPGRPIVEEYAGRYYVLVHADGEYGLLHGIGAGKTWSLQRAQAYRDPLTGQNVVTFSLDPRGGQLFGELTGANVNRSLCIFLDNQAISHANIIERITQHCQIKGNFTPERANNLTRTLEAGSLPARLKETPLSEVTIGPSLGQTNRERGLKASIWAGITVLLFVLVYYGFAGGSVVNIALILNMLFALATMALMQATFTLPGIAGLILSVAMAVDANVLIFERFREERARGLVFKKALNAGYDRAFSTILDSHVTTIITSVILVFVGSEEVKGFGIVLGIGIAVSLFTSLTVTRLIFNTLIAKDLLHDIRMIKLFKAPSVDWLALRRFFFPISAAAVLGGIGLFFAVSSANPQSMFDIEFLGGTSVQIDLKPGVKMTDDEVSERITSTGGGGKPSAVTWLEGAAESLASAQLAEADTPGQFRIQSPKLAGSQLSTLLSTTLEPFVERNGTTVEANSATFTAKPGKLTIESFRAAVQTAASRTRDTADILKGARVQSIASGESSGSNKLSYEVVTTATHRAMVQEAIVAALRDELSIQRAIRFTTKGDGVDPFYVVEEDDQYLSDVIGGDAPYDVRAFRGGLAVKLVLDPDEEPLSKDEFERRMREVSLLPEFEQLRTRESEIYPLGAETRLAEGGVGHKHFVLAALDEGFTYSSERREEWSEQVAGSEIKLVSAALGSEKSLSKVIQFAPQVAGAARSKAMFAMVVSLMAITAYLWLRFGTMDYGLAAIMALVHDVCTVLGILTICHFIHDTFIGRLLLLEEFKMDSAMLAAILTVIGYSINDKIVVFDRIREVRGKLSGLTANVINTSINQTLSRTLLTSITTFLTLAVLYILGGKGVHGFSFAMFIGVAVGTYSSFGVAAPLLYQPRLLWAVTAIVSAILIIAAIMTRFEPGAVRWVLIGLTVLVFGGWLLRSRGRRERMPMGQAVGV